MLQHIKYLNSSVSHYKREDVPGRVHLNLELSVKDIYNSPIQKIQENCLHYILYHFSIKEDWIFKAKARPICNSYGL